VEKSEEFKALSARFQKIAPGISSLQEEIELMIKDRLNILIERNDEEARGGIKALRALLDLPLHLKSEMEQLETGLSQGDPDF
jgi:hypothetical protein